LASSMFPLWQAICNGVNPFSSIILAFAVSLRRRRPMIPDCRIIFDSGRESPCCFRRLSLTDPRIHVPYIRLAKSSRSKSKTIDRFEDLMDVPVKKLRSESTSRWTVTETESYSILLSIFRTTGVSRSARCSDKELLITNQLRSLSRRWYKKLIIRYYLLQAVNNSVKALVNCLIIF